MILKLTMKGEQHYSLIDTTGMVVDGIAPNGYTMAFQANRVFFVKETIEEIIQQIKEGGMTNGTN